MDQNGLSNSSNGLSKYNQLLQIINNSFFATVVIFTYLDEIFAVY